MDYDYWDDKLKRVIIRWVVFIIRLVMMMKEMFIREMICQFVKVTLELKMMNKIVPKRVIDDLSMIIGMKSES